MKKALFLILMLVLGLVLAGCCQNQQAFQQAQAYKVLLQNTYYTTSGTLKPQIKEMGQYDAYVALGATLADQGLALASAIQGQYCASKADLEKLQATTQTAVTAVKVPPTSAPAP